MCVDISIIYEASTNPTINSLSGTTFMQTLISSVVKRLRKVYQKAEEFIEEEREFALSASFVNATMERYVIRESEDIPRPSMLIV